MRKHSFSFLVIMLATGVFASTAPAQGIFSGIVLDHENNEFEGATIIMESTSSARSSSGARHEVTSDAGGRFVMIGLASGQWTITVEAEGFQPQSSTTTIRQGPNSPINIYLERILHPLEIALGDALGKLHHLENRLLAVQRHDVVEQHGAHTGRIIAIGWWQHLLEHRQHHLRPTLADQ